MRAIVMTGVGGPEVLVVRDVPRPEPDAEELVIRTEAVPVLYPETALRSGAFPTPVAPPFVFGYQAVGTVVATGSRVDDALYGRRVGVAAGSGAYADYVAAPAASATPIPDGLDAATAAATLMSGSVALELLDAAALTGTETVLVEAAATGVGAALTQLAAGRGVRVLATAGEAAKAERARTLGAEHVFDHRDPHWVDRLRDELGPASVDVVFDSIGGESAAAMLEVLTPLTGRLLGYGFLSGAPASVTAADLIARGLTFVGCAGPHWLDQVAGRRADALELAAAGSLDCLVESVLPLEQAAEAHRLVEARTPLGKIILRPRTS
ncbi:quinone oxidoreductase family protein [Nocardia bovistercoris]|uniref:Zinc-binding dehydrogenase n=1 Tax=Nocardia bovistercoris TaxID=2785916 RepID=A0A931I650_9NOCA|nr:zinc-binding dehydrogenase [Nocardia bovistercoris]MBH0774911.1 zinc-binding dehydrogenase [Nocardia bovistercoris]